MSETPKAAPARAAFVALAWLAGVYVLGQHGYRLVPVTLASKISHVGFSLLIASVGLGFGLLVAWLLLPDPRRTLGLTRAPSSSFALAALLSPACYVLASTLAVEAALPTLLEELRRGGRQLVQQNAGEFGRSVSQANVGTLLLWTLVLAPLAEELLFRGAIYGFVQELVARLKRGAAASEESPSQRLGSDVISDPLPVKAARAVWSWALAGGVATLFSAGVFAAMHADMRGGQGIVRVVSTLVLGLCLGSARQLSGSLLVAVVLHALYNLWSLAALRHWIVSDTFPMRRLVPTLASACALSGLILAAALWVLLRQLRRRAQTSK